MKLMAFMGLRVRVIEMSNNTLNPTRQLLVDKYIQALKQDDEPTDIQLEQDVPPAQSPQEVTKNARERAKTKKRNNSDKSKNVSINSNRQVMSR